MTYTPTEKDVVTRMALAEGFEIIGQAVYDDLGVIRSANIRWADEIPGTISDVSSDAFGIRSIQFNRGTNKYIILNITRDAHGNVIDSIVQTIGFTL
jgi:hypothetical protein